MPVLDVLESRCLLSAVGGDPLGIATGAGPDTNIWFTLSSNNIGMINPANPNAGITQYAIPTPNSGPGPIAAGPQAILYASDNGKSQIYKVDKTTGAVLQTIPVAAPQDSLIFDSHNDLIYTTNVGNVGEIRRVDPTVGISSDTLIATVGFFTLDLTLMPGGRYVLAACVDSGKLYKVDLDHPGQTPTVIGTANYGGGITYDTAGRLFAVANSAIVELDPTTFKVIASSGPLSKLDGLAYDSFTGNLFASTYAVQRGIGAGGDLRAESAAGQLPPRHADHEQYVLQYLPSRRARDRREGNLYVASLGDKIYWYDIITGKMKALTSPLAGLDDLVPLSGAGGHSVPDYWFFEHAADQFGVINPTTGQITEIPLRTTADPRSTGSPPVQAGRSGSPSTTPTGLG